MDLALKTCLDEAEQGKRLLEGFYRQSTQGEGGRTAILLFPTGEARLLAAAQKYLDPFLAERYYTAAVVVQSVGMSHQLLRGLTGRRLSIWDVDEEAMAHILRFAAFVPYKDLRVLSLNEPFVRRAGLLAGFKDLSLEKLVCMGLYGMQHFAQGAPA
ncbi:MAG: hypothetical protein AB7V55_00300 [Oscillospiraceae bacterium]